MAQRIALHDSEGMGFPNLALMKIAAWHKSRGDTVEWFMPLSASEYDRVYSSKVFTFTPEYPYLPPHTVKGGTGYGDMGTLPDEIETMRPDYALYPGHDFALGFLTRGCIRSCTWCVVPKKEGRIRANAHIEDFMRSDTRNVVLMDNNVLAHEHGIAEIERMGGMNIRVDFNQGLDARLIADDDGIAKILARLKWYKPLRMACDTSAQMPYIERAAAKLRNHGCKPNTFFCYVLVNDIRDALERVEFLRKIKIDPFAQPYRDFSNGGAIVDPEQRKFARWVNHKAIFKTVPWEKYNR